ncbi:hypothetical protein C8R44DRAFT_771081 [Mycena epipterygia]|nr:hypothetical protein C8R44DRAFT_771081 [Mycena epipterygia]
MSVSDHRDAVIQAVEDALGVHRVLHKMAGVKRRMFALDLALIALSCRCGWLVDIMAVQNPEHIYADLLRSLREIDPIFDGVEHLFEPCSQQSFFVNTAQCPEASGSATDVAFVVLREDPWLLACAPPDVLDALRALATTPPTLPRDLEPRTAIPLAAVLLGYPVAYVPSEAAFLAQTPLDVYACTVCASTWEHTLLKFSCPAALAVAHPARLAPARIIANLTARFEPRARELGLTLVVNHSTEIMDRVAL